MFWVNQTLEPKRAFRFIVRFNGMTDAATWYATKATKPNVEVSETEHKYLNHNFYFPGRTTWSTVSLTLVDPATPDAVSELHQMLVEAGYIVPSNPQVLQSISKDRAVSQAGSLNTPGIGGTIEILQLDADGNTDEANVLEKWTLRNAWVKTIKPSELSYDSEDLSTIEIEIRYDWAELKSKGKNAIHSINEEIDL
jgi:hypothetical protein